MVLYSSGQFLVWFLTETSVKKSIQDSYVKAIRRLPRKLTYAVLGSEFRELYEPFAFLELSLDEELAREFLSLVKFVDQHFDFEDEVFENFKASLNDDEDPVFEDVLTLIPADDEIGDLFFEYLNSELSGDGRNLAPVIRRKIRALFFEACGLELKK
jgi:hypothetical protein